MKVTWRQLPTVLFEDEVLDKAFSRARKAADRVEDPNRVFRTRKQMTRMVQTAADIIHTMLTETVQTWPSLDQSPQFDVAMIEACVGTDDYRHHLSMLQWGASQVQRIATQNNRKIIRTARIELMHEARREAYGRIGSIMGRVGPSLKWLNESREILKALPQIDSSLPVIVVCGAPNVGKSAFISALHPGTWKSIIIRLQQNRFTSATLHSAVSNTRWWTRQDCSTGQCMNEIPLNCKRLRLWSILEAWFCSSLIGRSHVACHGKTR